MIVHSDTYHRDLVAVSFNLHRLLRFEPAGCRRVKGTPIAKLCIHDENVNRKLYTCTTYTHGFQISALFT